MCGRVVINVPDVTKLLAEFGVTELRVAEWTPRFNLAPTQLAPVITNEAERAMTLMRFGLLPFWSKTTNGGASMINARVETVATKNSFRSALVRRRCIIPVSGYYEWQVVGTRKQPLYIHPREPGQVIALSGVWERWRSPVGDVIESFAILTRPSEGFLTAVHDRMPLVVPDELLDLWLNPEAKSAEQLAAVLQSAGGAEHLIARPVSTLVNSVVNDAAECIEEAAPLPPDRQLDLF
jgi:putative SOS response-associated peptidase YedK